MVERGEMHQLWLVSTGLMHLVQTGLYLQFVALGVPMTISWHKSGKHSKIRKTNQNFPNMDKTLQEMQETSERMKVRQDKMNQFEDSLKEMHDMMAMFLEQSKLPKDVPLPKTPLPKGRTP
jgi:hypothetical protein